MAAAGHGMGSETVNTFPTGTDARDAVPMSVHRFGLTRVAGGDQYTSTVVGAAVPPRFSTRTYTEWSVAAATGSERAGLFSVPLPGPNAVVGFATALRRTMMSGLAETAPDVGSPGSPT